MLCVLLSIVSAAFKKLPRGERRCAEGGKNPSELRAKWSHNSGSGWPTRRGGFLRLGRSTHHETVLYGTARRTSAARRGIFQRRPLSSLPNPLWTRRPPPQGFLAHYMPLRQPPSPLRRRVYTCDRALPCSPARDEEEKRERERKNDTTKEPKEAERASIKSEGVKRADI